MKVLLEVEAQTLAEGREWTRQRLEERLQAQADQIEAVCPQSGLVLKYVRLREFSLMTCVGTVTVRAAYGFSSLMQRWLSPAREQWELTPHERVSPQLQERLCYTATQTGSYQKAALLASCWGTTISDDLVHSQVQSIGLQVDQQVMPAPTGAPKNEAPFSLVIMLDGWMVRERGPQWAAPPDCQDAERVAWHEVKSGTFVALRVVDRQNLLVASNGTENLVLPITAEQRHHLAQHQRGIPLTISSAVTIQAHVQGLER